MTTCMANIPDVSIFRSKIPIPNRKIWYRGNLYNNKSLNKDKNLKNWEVWAKYPYLNLNILTDYTQILVSLLHIHKQALPKMILNGGFWSNFWCFEPENVLSRCLFPLTPKFVNSVRFLVDNKIAKTPEKYL